ncbi:MAG: M20/M25/M40 family metallo-hydrolase [Marinomonas sp.]
MFFNGHTATLLATARWLKQFEAELPQPVVLIFQPAEEGFHGARE